MDKSAPSKESLERARNWMTHNLSDWDSAEAEWLAIEFDAIALESERNVCQILRGENSSTADAGASAIEAQAKEKP